MIIKNTNKVTICHYLILNELNHVEIWSFTDSKIAHM